MNRRIAGMACAVCMGLWVSGSAFARDVEVETQGEDGGIAPMAAPIASGDGAIAEGEDSEASGEKSIAIGVWSRSAGFGSIAFGYNAFADYEGSMAFGTDSAAAGLHAFAFGANSVAIDEGAIAFGGQAEAQAMKAIAIGQGAIAMNGFSIALGAGSKNEGSASVTVGADSTTYGMYNTSIGTASKSRGMGSTAVGAFANADGWDATVVGVGSYARMQGVAMGSGSYAEDLGISIGTRSAAGSAAVGIGVNVLAVDTGTAVGADALARWRHSSAFGSHAIGWEENSSAFGAYARAINPNSTALGAYSDARADNSVALGKGAQSTRANTVSVGSTKVWHDEFGNPQYPHMRQIVNVAAGTEANDVVIVSQLESAIANVTGTVGDGLGGFQTTVTGLQGRMSALEAAFGKLPAEPVVPTPAAAPVVGTGEGVAFGAGSSAVADSVALGNGAVASEAGTVSVGNAGEESRVVHVADATASTDAVNLRQMQTAQTATASEARAYTDQRVQALSDQFVDFDDRLDKQDVRIDRVGAMSSAMMSMSINAAQSRSERGRLAAGVGWQNGENAMSVGYARSIGRMSLSIGGAFSSDDRSAGVGFGIDL